MARPPEDWDPSEDELVESDEDEAYEAEEDEEREPSSATPMIMGIIGIILWFVCGIGAIGSIILGVKGQRRAHELGQPDTLCKVAWIGGIVVICLDIIGLIFLPSRPLPEA